MTKLPAKQRLPHTPFLDAWRADLAAATAQRGLKAELARHLSASRGTSTQVAQNLVHRITSGRILPNGEDVLEISHWITSRTATGHPAAGTRPRKRNYS